jgi:hypothetical protein
MAFDPDEFIKKNKDTASESNAAPVSTPAATFDPEQFIASAPAVETVAPPAQNTDDMAAALSMAAIPVATGIATGLPQGINTASTIAGPTVTGAYNAAKGIGGAYLRNPGALAIDAAASSMGLPPPTAAAKIEPLYKGVNQTYVNAKDYINKTGQFAPTVANTPENISRILSSPDVNAASNQIAAQQAAGAKSPIVTAPPPPPAVNTNIPAINRIDQIRAAALNPPAPVPIGGPAAQQGATFIQRISQQFAPMAARVGPVLNAVGRAAIPAQVGMGLLYTSPEEIATLKAAEERRRRMGQ